MVCSCRCKCSRACMRAFFRKNALLFANMAAIVLGLALGFGLRRVELSSNAIVWIGLWGELFIRMIKMLILPIIVVNLILGVSTMEAKVGSRLGAYSMAYIVLTNLLGCCIGVAVAMILKPGAGLAESSSVLQTDKSDYSTVFADLIRNLFPDNLIKATFEQVKTVKTESVSIGNITNVTTVKTELGVQTGTNVLGLTVFSIAAGCAVFAVGETAKPLIRLLEAINAIVFWLMNLVMWYSPLGITSLVAASIIKIDNLELAMASLGMFILATLIGVAVHVFVFMHPLLFLFIRRNPYKINLRILDGVLAALSPPAGIVAMPYFFRTLEDKEQVDTRVTKFYLPISHTLNRDTSLMFICVAAIFCAQTFSVSINAGTLVVMIFLATALSTAIAAVPSSSVVLLLMLSGTINVPVAERLGLIMAVEWVNDRLRTIGNVISIAFGCLIVEKLVKKELDKEGQPDDVHKTPKEEENGLLTNVTNV